jgi:hypothetical protein
VPSPPPGTAPCTSGPLRTLYATASGYPGTTSRTHRILKSTDAGATWSNIDGLPADIDHATPTRQWLQTIPLVIDPLHPQTLYVGTSPAYDITQVATPTIASGVFRSDDGGATWTPRSNGLPYYPGSATTHLDVFALAIHPTNPNVLWASAYNFSSLPHTGYAHIYKSTDGGATWADSSTGISAGDIRQLLVDPSDPNTIYAAAAGYFSNPTGVYKSSDGGATWHSISVGMENGGPTSVAIDPNDPSILYAGSSNGVSTLHQLADTDHDGVPDVVEMAGPNGGDANHDGIPDYQQADVVSTGIGASSASWTPLAADLAPSPATAASYVTINVTPATSGTCDQTVDAQTVDPASVPADAIGGVPFQYPQALVRFELLPLSRRDRHLDLRQRRVRERLVDALFRPVDARRRHHRRLARSRRDRTTRRRADVEIATHRGRLRQLSPGEFRLDPVRRRSGVFGAHLRERIRLIDPNRAPRRALRRS